MIARPAPDELVLVQQYRHPLGRKSWEVCAGGIDPGESPHEAALRELREETGFRARTLRRLWSAYSAPGFCSELLHFFETDDYEIGEPENVDEEDIEIATFPLGRLREMIERDELPDSKTQIAVLWALTRTTTCSVSGLRDDRTRVAPDASRFGAARPVRPRSCCATAHRQSAAWRAIAEALYAHGHRRRATLAAARSRRSHDDRAARTAA